MECYKDFAHIYDELIQSDIDYKAFSNSIISICKEKGIEFESYLDLACGTGNLTKEVAKSFKHIWGVDLSEDMLMEADRKLREEKIKGRLVVQDISELQLNRKFDLITCCLDSTNYILEEEAVESYFRAVKEHLKHNGIFIFDINSYYKLSTIMGDNVFTYNTDEVVYLWENTFENEIAEMYLTFFVKHGDTYERFDEEHFERAYKEDKIEELLKKCDFKIIEKLDSYNRQSSVNEKTERIVYVVK